VFRKCFPEFKFYQYIENFLDAQIEYSRIFDKNELVSLQRLLEALFNAKLCKVEQISNWDRRPLRLTQQHYASLDAFCLIRIIDRLEQIAKDNGK